MNSLDEALAELAVLEAVAGLGMPVELHERLTARRLHSWKASVGVHPVKYDGKWSFELPDLDPDYNSAFPRGLGDSRRSALEDLLRALRRVTFGLVAIPDAGTNSTRMVQVAWFGTGLRLIEQPNLS